MTAPTPFTSTPVAFTGQLPVLPPLNDIRTRQIWVCTPSGNVQLSGPNKATSVAWNTGRQAHALMGGGTAVTRQPFRTRTWEYTWGPMSERDWQVLSALDSGAFGAGPYGFLPAEAINVLTRDLASFTTPATFPSPVVNSPYGVTLPSWNATAGTVNLGQTPSLPQTIKIGPSKMGAWTLPGTFPAVMSPATVTLGTPTVVPNVAFAIPKLPVPFTFSVYVSASSATVAAGVYESGANGVVGGFLTGTSTSLTSATSWTQLTVSHAADNLTANETYLTPYVTATAGSGQVFFCNAQFSYTPSVMPWVLGGGFPRVVLSTELEESMSYALMPTVSATFSEAFGGAA